MDHVNMTTGSALGGAAFGSEPRELEEAAERFVRDALAGERISPQSIRSVAKKVAKIVRGATW